MAKSRPVIIAIFFKKGCLVFTFSIEKDLGVRGASISQLQKHTNLKTLSHQLVVVKLLSRLRQALSPQKSQLSNDKKNFVKFERPEPQLAPEPKTSALILLQLQFHTKRYEQTLQNCTNVSNSYTIWEKIYNYHVRIHISMRQIHNCPKQNLSHQNYPWYSWRPDLIIFIKDKLEYFIFKISVP